MSAYFRNLTRSHPGRTRTGTVVHAVAHDLREYDGHAFCGVSCSTVDRTIDFDCTADGVCRRCALAAFQTRPMMVVR